MASPGSEGGSVSSPETEDLGDGEPETSRVMEGRRSSIIMVKFVKNIWGL